MSGTLPDTDTSEVTYVAVTPPLVNGKDAVSMEEVDLTGSTNVLLADTQQLPRERSESDESHPDDGETSPLTVEEYIKPSIEQKEKGLKVIIISSVVFAISVTTALIIHICVGPSQLEPHGAVSCGVEQCSVIGAETLHRGGHAVDAAIATLLCMGVVNAQSSGIGGGGFMIVKDKRSVQAIDFRETAPSRATEDMYSENATLADIGGLSVAVPGELRGMEMAWKHYGKLPWSDLFQPAIDLARHGFKVTSHTVECVAGAGARMAQSSKLRDIYMPGGVPVKEGDTLKRLDLAEVLQVIATHSVEAFYNGNLTNDIITAVNQAGGILTKEDLKKYTPKFKPVLQTSYHEHTVYTVPEPSGGAIFLSIANILEGYNLTADVQDNPLTYHRMIEAFKYAYAQRTQLGDPDFVENVGNLTKIMISKYTAAEIRDKINDNKTYAPYHYGPFFPSLSHGTAHVSVIDTSGNMVAVTSTVNERFGSGVVTESGILLNDEMADFDWPNKHPNVSTLTSSKSNYIQPGKRPQSSTVPLIAVHESQPCNPMIAVGGDGGTMITTGVAQVFLDILSYGNPVKESIDKPRVHHQLIPNEVIVEADVPDTVVEGLESRGHQLETRQPLGNEIMAVMKKNDKLTGYADPRKKGSGAVVF
ncbi:scoloptoxin SSD14-like [Glandiceps talaboti]